MTSSKFLSPLGLSAAVLAGLLMPGWGGPGEENWRRPYHERVAPMANLHVAMAQASEGGAIEAASVPLGPPRPAGVPEGPAQIVRVAASHGDPGERPAPPEDGKEPRPTSGIPLPPILPSPRIEIPVAPDGGSPVPDGWSLKEFVGKAKLKVEKVGGLFAVHLNSERASFSLHKDITVDVNQYPFFSWVWRVDRLPPKGDVRQKETDDQAAQLYVIFPRFPAMVRSQIIGYVWDSTAPPGAVLNSPSNRMAKIIVVRGGAERLGQWVLETRNVLEDFRRLFGENPPKVGKISLLINSQNTRSSAESWFAGLVFTRTPIQRDLGMSAEGSPSRAQRESGSDRLRRVN